LKRRTVTPSALLGILTNIFPLLLIHRSFNHSIVIIGFYSSWARNYYRLVAPPSTWFMISESIYFKYFQDTPDSTSLVELATGNNWALEQQPVDNGAYRPPCSTSRLDTASNLLQKKLHVGWARID
jgi:hypothetical protein